MAEQSTGSTSNGILTGARRMFGGARQRAQSDARRLLPRWTPSKPQQLVLAGVLVVAFLELRVANKFGDVWTLAFSGHLGSEAKSSQHETSAPPPDPVGRTIAELIP